MFSQACVKNSVRGGGRGHVRAGETATAADGTHPTGMNSCSKGKLVDKLKFQTCEHQCFEFYL